MPLSLPTKLELGELDKKLLKSSKYGNIESIRSLITKKADLGAVDVRGNTSLHNAAREGKIIAISALLDAQANVNVTNACGNAPLHLAASKGLVATIKTLIDAKANVDAVNKEGETPLHLAICHIPATKSLIGYKADLNKLNIKRQTPLYYASLRNKIKTVKIYFEEGEGVNLLKLNNSKYHCSSVFDGFKVYINSVTPDELAKIEQEPEKLKKIQDSGLYNILKIMNYKLADDSDQQKIQDFKKMKQDFLYGVFYLDLTNKRNEEGQSISDIRHQFCKIEALKLPQITKILESQEFSDENKFKIIEAIAANLNEFKEFIALYHQNRIKYQNLDEQALELSLISLLPTKIKDLDVFKGSNCRQNLVTLISVVTSQPSCLIKNPSSPRLLGEALQSSL